MLRDRHQARPSWPPGCPTRSPDEEVGVVGISYDPGYDTPERLAAYGAARGLAFSDTVRLLRAPTGHAVLREHFDLTVGYAGSLVNQHGVELYLVGETPAPARLDPRHLDGRRGARRP